MIPFRTPFLDLQYVPAVIDAGARHRRLCRPRRARRALWLFAAVVRVTFLPEPVDRSARARPRHRALPVARAAEGAALGARGPGHARRRAVADQRPLRRRAPQYRPLVMFLMALAAGLLLLGPLPRGAAGYALILLGRLLKFYPLALFALALRECLRHVAWVSPAGARVRSWRLPSPSPASSAKWRLISRRGVFSPTRSWRATCPAASPERSWRWDRAPTPPRRPGAAWPIVLYVCALPGDGGRRAPPAALARVARRADRAARAQVQVPPHRRGAPSAAASSPARASAIAAFTCSSN